MIVARKAGYSRGAVREAIRMDEELSRMMQDEAETINDYAEITLIDKIKDGDENSAKWWMAQTIGMPVNNSNAIARWLKVQGAL